MLAVLVAFSVGIYVGIKRHLVVLAAFLALSGVAFGIWITASPNGLLVQCLHAVSRLASPPADTAQSARTQDGKPRPEARPHRGASPTGASSPWPL